MTDAETREENKIENFDALYLRELELQQEFEKIEVAYVKTAEKYGEYADLKAFVEYLCTMEKLFAENKFRKLGFAYGQDELIKMRMKFLAKNTFLEEEVLHTIYDYFKKAGQSVDKIYAITKELLAKYGDNKDCQDFILYIQDIFVNFLNAEKEGIGMDELKNRLIKARMETLSSSGNPALLKLENIYQEFRGLLSE